MKHRGMIALIFIIGCATGGVASQVVVVAPPARADSNATRWEYFCAETSGDLSLAMAASGREGWELVSAFATKLDHKFNQDLEAAKFAFCMKRALP